MRPAEPLRLAPDATTPVVAWDFPTTPEAPVVIGLHDFTANGLWFGDLAEACAGHAHLVAPDLRGRAGSLTAPLPRSAADHVSDVLGLADRLGAAAFMVVGHGTGAWLALQVAVTEPARVHHIVTLDGPPITTVDTTGNWTTAAAHLDPGIGRLGHTYVHRDALVAEAIASGRLPAEGLTRSLRRAVDAEVSGAGFLWRARLGAATLERDWHDLAAWSPPLHLDALVTSFRAAHGHRIDDPSIDVADPVVPGARARIVPTTHTGLLWNHTAVSVVAEAIAAERRVPSPNR